MLFDLTSQNHSLRNRQWRLIYQHLLVQGSTHRVVRVGTGRSEFVRSSDFKCFSDALRTDRLWCVDPWPGWPNDIDGSIGLVSRFWTNSDSVDFISALIFIKRLSSLLRTFKFFSEWLAWNHAFLLMDITIFVMPVRPPQSDLVLGRY